MTLANVASRLHANASANTANTSTNSNDIRAVARAVNRRIPVEDEEEEDVSINTHKKRKRSTGPRPKYQLMGHTPVSRHILSHGKRDYEFKLFTEDLFPNGTQRVLYARSVHSAALNALPDLAKIGTLSSLVFFFRRLIIVKPHQSTSLKIFSAWYV